MTRCVLSIDPGGTSGMALRLPTGQVTTFVCKSPEEVYDFISENKNFLANVVIENFAAETVGRWALFTIRIVGGVYALCYSYGIEHTVHQPQDRYPFMKEARALLGGKRVEIHEVDALGHLLRWEFDKAKEEAKIG